MLPPLTDLATDWMWLVDLNQLTLLRISPFGDLFLKDSTDAFCLLDVNLGRLEWASVPGDDPAVLFPISFDLRIASDYVKSGLVPPLENQCFGYKRQLVTGGSLHVTNVYIAQLTEYISFMGNFHHQIQDIPDGTTVTIKVINRRVIQ